MPPRLQTPIYCGLSLCIIAWWGGVSTRSEFREDLSAAAHCVILSIASRSTVSNTPVENCQKSAKMGNLAGSFQQGVENWNGCSPLAANTCSVFGSTDSRIGSTDGRISSAAGRVRVACGRLVPGVRAGHSAARAPRTVDRAPAALAAAPALRRLVESAGIHRKGCTACAACRAYKTGVLYNSLPPGCAVRLRELTAAPRRGAAYKTAVLYGRGDVSCSFRTEVARPLSTFPAPCTRPRRLHGRPRPGDCAGGGGCPTAPRGGRDAAQGTRQSRAPYAAAERR